MKINILLIEDDHKKMDDIKSFLETKFPNTSLTIKESYQSGLRTIIQDKFDLLLLDMSLPTWKSIEFEDMGSFEKFGGMNIMKEMQRRDIKVKTILITMFDDFGESDSSITLPQIDQFLRLDFSDFYLGYIFYNSRSNDWTEKLEKVLAAY
jgi:DNA-binding NarL/FixJ family response regulator